VSETDDLADRVDELEDEIARVQETNERLVSIIENLVAQRREITDLLNDEDEPAALGDPDDVRGYR
jgi:flagellar biosynthesis/type III secretory pathway chaperone